MVVGKQSYHLSFLVDHSGANLTVRNNPVSLFQALEIQLNFTCFNFSRIITIPAKVINFDSTRQLQTYFSSLVAIRVISALRFLGLRARILRLRGPGYEPCVWENCPGGAILCRTPWLGTDNVQPHERDDILYVSSPADKEGGIVK